MVACRVGGGVTELIRDGLRGERIHYNVVGGPFPVHTHDAEVSFAASAAAAATEGAQTEHDSPVASEGDGQLPRTLVTWSVEVQPYFLCWHIVRRLILWSFNTMLTDLAAKMQLAAEATAAMKDRQ